MVDELQAKLRTIEGLTVPEWGVQRISPPTVLIALPERIDYDNTYQRGRDVIPDLLVLVLVANPTRPEARRAVAAYANGSGPKSVKSALEAGPYPGFDVRVVWAEFDVVKYSDVDYLAAMFHLEISGEGEG